MITNNISPTLERCCVRVVNHVMGTVELPISRGELVERLLHLRRIIRRNLHPLYLGVCIGREITFHWHADDDKFAKAIIDAGTLPQTTLDLLSDRRIKT
jgi:hypothetical protein